LLTFASGNDIKKEEEYELFRKVCNILFERESYEELQRLAFSALGSPLFSRTTAFQAELEFLCLLGKKFFFSFRSGRPLAQCCESGSGIFSQV
jgi:hypothetical protein